MNSNIIIDKNKINTIVDKNFYSSSSNSSSSQLFDSYQIFPIYTTDIHNDHQINLQYDLIKQIIYMLTSHINDCKKCETQEEIYEIFDIRELMKLYNNALFNIAKLFNLYVYHLNNIMDTNIKPIDVKPVILNNYFIPKTPELVKFINNLATDVTNLYKEILNIPNLIGNTKTIDEIDDFISDTYYDFI